MNFKKYKHRSLAWLPLFSFALLLAAPGRADVWLIDVKGTIGPASADHMVRGLAAAQQNAAELVVLRIDTPGGLDLSMREMIKAILAAQVPVVGYVAPSGARAASAGTYLLYATQIAAMAPGTNLGAATPIQLGAPAVPQMPDAPAEEPAADGPYQGTAMERKVVNDAVAYIQSLAQLRGRNAQWAEKAVREGASLSAADALELGVIDILAPSLPDLLEQLDGREVEVGGAARILQLHGVQTYQHPVDWRSEFLAVITDPNIAYVLMLVGIYGLLIEFYNPGIGLMTAEAFAPSFGVLGLGGIVAFVVGSIMLMDTELPGYQIAMPMIAAFAVFSAALLVFALGMILRARRQAVRTGLGHLLGAVATVESVSNGTAWARLDGELWEVACGDTLGPEDRVVVRAIDGLTLQVSKDKGERG